MVNLMKKIFSVLTIIAIFFIPTIKLPSIVDAAPLKGVTPTTGLTTTEGGDTATFTIVLDSQPTADVAIDLNSTDEGEGTISPETITFTSLDWDQAQTITITGVDDDIDDGNIEYTIEVLPAVSTDPTYSDYDYDDVTVTNTDDDTAGITLSETSGLITGEDGTTDTFTIVLDSEPTANVTIGLSSDTPSEGTVSPTEVIFTPENWDSTQTVTITGIDDDVDDGDLGYNIVTATASSDDTNYGGTNPSDVSVTNTDDDTAGITVDPTSGLTTTEAGGTAQFTIVLNSEPTANVTIDISSNDTSEGDVSPTTVTFSSLDWDIPQNITITGIDDALADGDVVYTIETAAAASLDNKYSSFDPADVTVTNSDDESPGITVNPTSGLTTTEEGGTAQFTIVLNSEPTDSVTIGVVSNDESEGTVSASSILFDNLNWSTPQTVTITGQDDSLDDGDISYTIELAAATSTDADYSGVDPNDVSVTNLDDDSPPVANNDVYGLQEDATLIIDAHGILANDTDDDGVENLQAEIVTDVSHGTLTYTDPDEDNLFDGAFTYIPDENYYGVDSFTYKAFDGLFYSNITTVTFNISSLNDVPIAQNDSYSVDEDQQLTESNPGVLENDSDEDENNPPGEEDTITAVLETSTQHGVLTLNSNGSFSYSPNDDYFGEDEFTYKAYDGKAYSTPATVTITINPINDPPTAANDTYRSNADHNNPLSVAAPGILANDNDLEDTSLTAIKETEPINGTITSWPGDGSFQYLPNEGFEGNDSFTYKVFDGEFYSSAVTVSITIDKTPPPAPEWTSPVSSSEYFYIHSGTVTLTVTLPTVPTDFSRMVLTRWDPIEEKYVSIGQSTEVPFNATIQVDNLVVGWNHLFAQSFDTAGNSAYSFIVIVRENQTKVFLPLIQR